MKKTKGMALLLLKFLIASYFISGIMLVLLALLLYKWHIPGWAVSIGIIATYFLSTFLTGFLAGKRMQHKKYLWGLAIGGLYFVILVLISLVVDPAQMQIMGSFWTTLLICLGSGMLGGMLS